LSIALVSPLIQSDPAALDERDEVGTGREEVGTLVSLPARRQSRTTSEHCLERLRLLLHAAAVALVRFGEDGTSFVVLDQVGTALLAPGAQLPLSISPALERARDTEWSYEGNALSDAAFDRLMVSVGLGYALVTPVEADDQLRGALTIGWRSREDVSPNAHALLAERRSDLVDTMASLRHRGRSALICHEDQLVGAGLAHTLERRMGATTSVAYSVESALTGLAARAPDLIICSDHLSEDVGLPEVARTLRTAGAAGPLVVLARAAGPHGLDRAMIAGAAGYVPLELAPERLAEAAATVLDGRSALPPLRPTVIEVPDLTRRERDVLRGIDKGQSDKQIAGELAIAISTVKTHARALYGKLEACSRTEAVHKAREFGLI
jgi:two-component system, NarL family, nitrate/nitrite response regulator NarL